MYYVMVKFVHMVNRTNEDWDMSPPKRSRMCLQELVKEFEKHEHV